MARVLRLSVLLLTTLVAFGCGNDNSTTTSPTSPTTITFSSVLAVGGSSARSFTTSAAGAIAVTLTSYGSGQPAGVGIGVPTSTAGAPCALAQSVVTAPGSSPQVQATADAGTYCVQIYDIGNLSGDTGFSVTIQYP